MNPTWVRWPKWHTRASLVSTLLNVHSIYLVLVLFHWKLLDSRVPCKISNLALTLLLVSLTKTILFAKNIPRDFLLNRFSELIHHYRKRKINKPNHSLHIHYHHLTLKYLNCRSQSWINSKMDKKNAKIVSKKKWTKLDFRSKCHPLALQFQLWVTW